MKRMFSSTVRVVRRYSEEPWAAPGAPRSMKHRRGHSGDQLSFCSTTKKPVNTRKYGEFVRAYVESERRVQTVAGR